MGRRGLKPVVFVLNNCGELDQAIQQASQNGSASYIEVVTDKYAAPPSAAEDARESRHALRVTQLTRRGPRGGARLPDTEVTSESAGIDTVDLVLFSMELCYTPPAAEALAKADLHEVEAERGDAGG